ncbi:hypothetical protein GCM10022409_34460 [Hymenobacter glaciei]|uniref:Secretion system C-terminal sorting domain-containing protein n=1 Tax=Hymenobacter glaciei TaxID=877209 RepID=A0ABP7UK73_9BACT
MFNFSSLPLPAALVRTLLALLFLTLHLRAAAQAPSWQSARAVATATAAASGNYSIVTATAVDAAGNVFLAGNFANTVVLGGTTLTSLGNRDVFVVKFNPASNQFMWAQRAGGTGNDYADALTVSGTNVYIAGYFTSSTAGFGPTTLANAGGDDIFVAKLTDAGSTGSFVWAQRAGGTGDDEANALVVGGTSVYVAGSFSSFTVGFGTATLTSAGTSDVFVTKLTDAGSSSSFVWAQQAGGTNGDFANALAVSGTSVYVAGVFASSTADFGTITLTNTNVTSSDVFVAKLTDAGSTGSFAWAQRAGGTGSDFAIALATNGTSVYVAGGFASLTAGFGANTLTNAGIYDVFVAKLTDAGSTGSFVWALRAGGTGSEVANALVVSGNSVYLAGGFDSPTAGFGTTPLTNMGFSDVFVAKLTDAGSTGSFAWAQRAGGTGNDASTALVVSATSVYVAGYFASSTASFSATTLSNSSPVTNLGFLASLTDATLTATTAAVPREAATLFPNPARRTATLRLPAGTTPAPLTLTDALGRAVRHYPAPTSAEAALDLQGLPAGLYLLRGAGPAQRLVLE